MMNRFRGWCCLIALMATMACVTTYAAEEVFIPKVLGALPFELNVDFQHNLVLFASGDILHAYEMDTGERRWWNPLYQGGKYYNVRLGKDYAVIYCKEGFSVYENETGHEVWKEYAGEWRSIRSLYFCQSDLLWRYDENRVSLYDWQTRQEYQIPSSMQYIPRDLSTDTTIGYRLSSDRKVIYGIKSSPWRESPMTITLFSWETGKSTVKEHFSIELPGQASVSGISDNLVMVSEWRNNSGRERILRTYDLETGEMVTEFDAAISNTCGTHIRKNHNFYFWGNNEKHLMHRLDVVSGDFVSVPVPEAQDVWSGMGLFEDPEGHFWFTTIDGDQNFFLLPFEHDASPRKLIDGKMFVPGHWTANKLHPPYLWAPKESGTSDCTRVYRLEGMEKVVEWPGVLECVNADMTLGAVRMRVMEDAAMTVATCLVRNDSDTPLFKVKGVPLALSSDSRYLVVGPSSNHAWGMADLDNDELRKKLASIHIVEVESQQVVAQSDANMYSNKAAFSPDSRLLALNNSETLKIIDTGDGFTEKMLFVPGKERIGANHICFSPDSNYLLISGRGQADVFDTTTGKHITTLKETRRFPRFAISGSGDPNLLQRAESKVRDFIGQYTDIGKNLPQIQAKFAEGGSQVVTVADNMLIRVWETKTGRLIRTIDPELPEKRGRDGFLRSKITLSGNGAYALTYNWEGFDTGTLWDLEKGVKIRCYTFEGASHIDAAISEDGTKVYALINGNLHYLAGAKK